MIFAATILSWFAVAVGLWLARLKMKTHRQFIVPGLALIALMLGMEACELVVLAGLADWSADPVQYSVAALVSVRLLTLLRYGTLLGFWLAMRYAQRAPERIETTWNAFQFACVGWRCFIGRVVLSNEHPPSQR